MLVKRKLYSVIDKEGNLGYCLYNESTGEEKLFSVVEEEERMYARGVGNAVTEAVKRASTKGNKVANKAAKRIDKVREKRLKNFLSKNKELIGLDSPAVPKYISSETGRTIINPEWNPSYSPESMRSTVRNKAKQYYSKNPIHDKINKRVEYLEDKPTWSGYYSRKIDKYGKDHAGLFNEQLASNYGYGFNRPDQHHNLFRISYKGMYD